MPKIKEKQRKKQKCMEQDLNLLSGGEPINNWYPYKQKLWVY